MTIVNHLIELRHPVRFGCVPANVTSLRKGAAPTLTKVEMMRTQSCVEVAAKCESEWIGVVHPTRSNWPSAVFISFGFVQKKRNEPYLVSTIADRRISSNRK